jgi:hypothetical protein
MQTVPVREDRLKDARLMQRFWFVRFVSSNQGTENGAGLLNNPGVAGKRLSRIFPDSPLNQVGSLHF